LCVLQGDFVRTAFEAGMQSAFLKEIAGCTAQIFENLVGREVEVMLARSCSPPQGGALGRVKQLIRQ
jgi:hypothetical protein